jgi:Domain of unknown function (DUF362)/TAT (twin-arginine translocation) pathway signal sequence
MKKKSYRSMDTRFHVNRRDFLKAGSIAGAGMALGGAILGSPTLWAQDTEKQTPPAKPKTNIDEIMKIPRTKDSIPGPFPGKTVEVLDGKSILNDKIQADRVKNMFEKGLQQLTGKDLNNSFKLMLSKDDVIGIKVNPVGPGLIATNHELVDVIIEWLEANNVKRQNIIIWDRFDYMLKDAGFTPERYPGIGLEGLQTMDEAAAMGESDDDSGWLDKDGNHLSVSKFDKDVYYWADIEAPQDKPYLNQHVFNDKNSYFGNLVTKKLTKIINVPVFKNTGNGISMATKNLGYGAICNTGRLHRPLFFDVCTEVMAFPAIRDKLVLNVIDGLHGQYDGGPMSNAEFVYNYNTIFLATDPFALDMVAHNILVKKRKEMKIDVNEHPMFTEYLRYAEKLGLGVVNESKTEHLSVTLG